LHLSSDDVLEIIGDLAQPIQSVPFRAWGEVVSDPRSTRYQFPRTRSNIMFDEMTRIAREVIGDDQDVIEHREHGSVLWIIRERLLLRYKKLDTRRRPMNIRTQRTIDLLSQPETYRAVPLPFGPLPTAAMPRVVVGYVLNELQTDIKELLLVLTNKGVNYWEYPFAIEVAGGVVDLSSLAPGQSGLPPIQPRRRGTGDAESERETGND